MNEQEVINFSRESQTEIFIRAFFREHNYCFATRRDNNNGEETLYFENFEGVVGRIRRAHVGGAKISIYKTGRFRHFLRENHMTFSFSDELLNGNYRVVENGGGGGTHTSGGTLINLDIKQVDINTILNQILDSVNPNIEIHE